MLKRTLALLFGVVTSFTASTKVEMPKDVGSWNPHHPSVDNSTYANTDQIIVTHQHADWGVNWITKQLIGSIIFDMTVVSDTLYVSFDAQNLEVESVQLMPAGSALAATLNAGVIPEPMNPLSFDMKYPNPQTGDVLAVQLPFTFSKGATLSIIVQYATQAGGNFGVNFLNANQTNDGVHPMLFTYTLDTYGRQIAPQQDTPSNRITWGACVTTDAQYTPFMSANSTGTYIAFYGYKKFCFYNEIAMPNYLMNLIVGDFVMKEITGDVYAPPAPTYMITEPGNMDAAIAAFEDLPAIFMTVQSYLSGPEYNTNLYPFGSFRLVVLPAVYPFQGLASPLLTYISQTNQWEPYNTYDAGNEPILVRLVAQHWFGAMVTHNNWEDYWLTESFGTAVERQVVAHFWHINQTLTDSFVGNSSLYEVSSRLGLPNATYYTLHPVLQGANPIEALNIAQFEKGYQFLYWLGMVDLVQYSPFGGQDFLVYYLQQNWGMSFCAFHMRQTLLDFVEGNYVDDSINMNLSPDQVNQVMQGVQFWNWIYNRGTDPTGQVDFMNDDIQEAIDLAMQYVNGTQPSNYLNYLKWYSSQQIVFIQTLQQNGVTADIMANIDANLNISDNTVDPEVKYRWYALGLYLNYSAVFGPCEEWVKSMGNNKYLELIYGACYQSSGNPSVLNMCTGWFNFGKNYYTQITIALINQILSS